MKNDIPNENWSLNDLADFLKATLRRCASDAWKIGKALSIAREKHKAKSKWLEWTKKNVGISTATIYRYLDVADRLTLEDCEQKTLNEVYAKIEEQRKNERAESDPSSSPPTSKSPAPDDNDVQIPETDERPGKPNTVGQPVNISVDGGDAPVRIHQSSNPLRPSWVVEDDEEDQIANLKREIEKLRTFLGAWIDAGHANRIDGESKQETRLEITNLEKTLAELKTVLRMKAAA